MIYDTKVLFYSENKRYVPSRGYVAGDGGTAVCERWANVTNVDAQTQQAVFGDVTTQAYAIRPFLPVSNDFKVSYVKIDGNNAKFKIGQFRRTLKGTSYIVGEAKGGAI